MKPTSMTHFRNIISLICFVVAISGCGTAAKFPGGKQSSFRYKDLSLADRQLADTLIKNALDNEGLFTVISGLKPISSVSNLTFLIAQKDTLAKGPREVTDTSSTDYRKLIQYQRIVRALQFGDLKFVMTPFNMNRNGNRTMQINVYRQSLVDSLLTANPQFYGQFGYVPGTNGALVINTTEYERKADRFRSYGYLFGYPEHAVTFFIAASVAQDEKKKMVERDFFQIPVFSGPTGHFVYALPKNSKPSPADLLIKTRASHALAQYKELRRMYVRPDSSLKAYDLLIHLIKQRGS